MKAWIVCDREYYCGATIVFAETAGKAKRIAQQNEELEDIAFKDLRATRVPALDSYYRGYAEMDWNDDKDRVAMVRHAGFQCSYEMKADDCPCDKCPATKWCGRYEEVKENA